MGLDGFSMGNLGLNTELTSAQMANHAEQIARKESQFKVKNINESAEENGVKRKENGDEQDNDSSKKKNKKQKNEEQELEIQEILDKKGFGNTNPREFSIRVNNETEMVELFNIKDRTIVESISAQELMGLLSKLDTASGILVNRKI